MAPDDNFIEEEAPWSDAAVMVCSKCFTRRGELPPDAPFRSAEEVKAYLKGELKVRGYQGKVRAVVSSCLDVCPEGRLAIVIARNQAQPGVQALSLDFGTELPELCDAIEARVRR